MWWRSWGGSCDGCSQFMWLGPALYLRWDQSNEYEHIPSTSSIHSSNPSHSNPSISTTYLSIQFYKDIRRKNVVIQFNRKSFVISQFALSITVNSVSMTIPPFLSHDQINTTPVSLLAAILVLFLSCANMEIAKSKEDHHPTLNCLCHSLLNGNECVKRTLKKDDSSDS